MKKTILILCLIIFSITGFARTERVLLGTSTSLHDSGLLDHLIPDFEKQHNIKVDIIATGTGNVLKLGEKKDIDILLVHSKKDELEFVENNFGDARHPFAYNYFVLLGPKDNKNFRTISQIFNKVSASRILFVSRSDDSGTYKKEVNLLKESNISLINKKNYIKTGSGMGNSLKIASELNAYILSDIATYLSLEEVLNLEIKIGKKPSLKNDYSLILVEDDKNITNKKGAILLMEYLLSSETKNKIDAYSEQFSEKIFYTDMAS